MTVEPDVLCDVCHWPAQSKTSVHTKAVANELHSVVSILEDVQYSCHAA